MKSRIPSLLLLVKAPRFHFPSTNFYALSKSNVKYIPIKNQDHADIVKDPKSSNHQEGKHSSGHGNSHGHDHFSRLYYSSGLAAVFGGFAYALIKGDVKKTIEDVWYDNNRPAILSDVKFGHFEPHQDIPIGILNDLKKRFLSDKNKNNFKKVVICGDGGIGKLAAAMNIAEALNNNNKDKDHFFSTTINLRGHTREEIEVDIIRAAIRLGINHDGPEIDDILRSEKSFKGYLTKAKEFLSSEIRKRPGTNVIVRCLRDVEILKEIENIIDPPQILPRIPPAKVALIVTTGDANIEKELKKKSYDSVSLNKSFKKEDLDDYFLKLKDCKITEIGSETRKHMVKDIFLHNPTLARIAIKYFENNPDLTIDKFKDLVDTCKSKVGECCPLSKEEIILKLSLTQLKEKYPFAEEILAMIAPKGVPQSAGLVVDSLLKDESSILDRVPQIHKDPAQHIRDTIDALEEYGLINNNTNKGKIYQTILIRQANYLRGEPPESQSSFVEGGGNTIVNVLRRLTIPRFATTDVSR